MRARAVYLGLEAVAAVRLIKEVIELPAYGSYE